MTTEPTASYRDREQWLAERKTGIGGSDAAAVLGVSPYRTPFELWVEKTSEAAEPELTSPPILRGRYLEPIAAQVYVEQTGREVRRQPMRRHAEHAFMIGNVDRQILAVGDVASTAVLEVKCPGLRVFAGVKARGLPEHMVVQLMHYLAVYGYSWGSFALFNAENWQLVHFDLEADERLIGTMVEREQEFWTQYVEPRVPPPQEALPAPEIPHVEGELTLVDREEWRQAALELQEAKALVEAAAGLEDAAKGKLQALMEAEQLSEVEVADLVRIYWRSAPGGTQWKATATALAKQAGLSVEDFIVKGAGSRPFKSYFLRRETED
jgi:putative phage-type endonuclease